MIQEQLSKKFNSFESINWNKKMKPQSFWIHEKHDTDWDRVPNYRDCDPFNPLRHRVVERDYKPILFKTAVPSKRKYKQATNGRKLAAYSIPGVDEVILVR